MSTPSVLFPPSAACSRWLFLLAVGALSACGGGGESAGAPAGAPVNNFVQQGKPISGPGLLLQAAVVIDTIPVEQGRKVNVALGALADGGSMVVWLVTNPTNALAPAPLSLQRQDAGGNLVGAPVRLQGLYDPATVAVVVQPDGALVITTRPGGSGTPPTLPFTLRLANGEAVLFTTNSRQPIDRGGQTAGPPQALSTPTDNAVALPGGGYVVVRAITDGVQRIAERYDNLGNLVGNAVFFSFRVPGVLATVLADGTVAVAWNDTVLPVTRVVTQRLLVPS